MSGASLGTTVPRSVLTVFSTTPDTSTFFDRAGPGALARLVVVLVFSYTTDLFVASWLSTMCFALLVGARGKQRPIGVRLPTVEGGPSNSPPLKQRMLASLPSCWTITTVSGLCDVLSN